MAACAYATSVRPGSFPDNRVEDSIADLEAGRRSAFHDELDPEIQFGPLVLRLHRGNADDTPSLCASFNQPDAPATGRAVSGREGRYGTNLTGPRYRSSQANDSRATMSTGI